MYHAFRKQRMTAAPARISGRMRAGGGALLLYPPFSLGFAFWVWTFRCAEYTKEYSGGRRRVILNRLGAPPITCSVSHQKSPACRMPTLSVG